MREPLVWAGGTRHTASGLVVELHSDEGLVGIGECPGPTLPAIQTIVEQELAQFLIGQDPRRVEWLVHRMEEFTRNWAQLGVYAIAGLEMALLDLKGKALDVPVAELLGDLGQDHDTLAAIRDRVGSEVKIRIDANMMWSVPAAIKWIRALERFDLQYVEQPVPDFDLEGMAQVRRAVAVPIAADEACTDMRSVLALLRAEACDVLVVYPSEAGGLTRARQIAAVADAAGKWCAIGSWAELGVATAANVHVVASSTNFPFGNDTHYPLQESDVLDEPLQLDGGRVEP